MTEQQAIKRIKDEIGWESSELNREAFEMGIKALEEVQQLRNEMWELNQICRGYTSLGTVEECKENKDFLEFLYNHILPNEMEQYLSMYHTKEKTFVNGYADQCGLISET